MLGKYLANVRAAHPLVHSITNYVTVNDVANAILAIGASPIMSDEPADVEDITSICNGLNLNIGTLNQRSIQGMHAAGRKARELGNTILFDPVSAGASGLRTSTATSLMDEVHPDVIRGNLLPRATIITPNRPEAKCSSARP
jgi:hydroxyethylthiazole kinase